MEETRRREQVKAQAAAALEQRRERLAAKLAREEDQLKQELLDQQVRIECFRAHSQIPG